MIIKTISQEQDEIADAKPFHFANVWHKFAPIAAIRGETLCQAGRDDDKAKRRKQL